MKVLITGHKGFIGQNMIKAAQKEGWYIETFDIVDDPKVRPKDLNYDEIDTVIHLGAISSTTETDIQKLMDLNLSWTVELLEQCLDRGVNMQFASSASVYGQNKNERILGENDICYPVNYYALSKYLFEQYTRNESIITIEVLCRFSDTLMSTDLTKNTRVHRQVHTLSLPNKQKKLVLSMYLKVQTNLPAILFMLIQ